MTLPQSKSVNIVILAAGQGKRMQNKEVPKVMTLFDGKPLIRYVIDAVHSSGISERPAIVIGYGADQVKAELGPDYDYVYQVEQLGTGHAVACAREHLQDKKGSVMVLYGDMPFITPETIRNLADTRRNSGSILTMGTVTVDDFNDWRQSLSSFGKIIRNIQGAVESIVEIKDATPEQLFVRECNPSFFCFDAIWLWKNLSELKNNNTQGEYYLTDLVGIAREHGDTIATIDIDAREALGVNTVQELELASKLKRERVIAIV